MGDDDSPARRRMREVGQEFAAARTRLDELRKLVHEAIPPAVQDNMPQAEIVALTGYNRERVRKIARAAGVGGRAGRGTSSST